MFGGGVLKKICCYGMVLFNLTLLLVQDKLLQDIYNLLCRYKDDSFVLHGYGHRFFRNLRCPSLLTLRINLFATELGLTV